MIKWQVLKKLLHINDQEKFVTFVNLFDRNNKLLHTHRCNQDSEVITIKKILTDIIYCMDYIEYYPLLEHPNSFDEDILLMANMIIKKHKIKYD